MRAVDTNVLVRLVVRDHAQQLAAATAYIEKGVWASLLAVAETIWVLASVYGKTAQEIVAAVEMLLHEKHLTIQDHDVVTAALEHFRTRPALGFSDCLLLEIARKAGHLPLGTFDRNLGKLDGAEKLQKH